MELNVKTIAHALCYFGVASVGLGVIVLIISHHVKKHVKILMGFHLTNNGILLLSVIWIGSKSAVISCYFKALAMALGFFLTYTSAVVLSIFNFAAVFYPHTFYKREMLMPACLATLASWVVGVLVSVFAVGFNILSVSACTPIPLMPRYGVMTLAIICLVCSLLVAAMNIKLVQYFRKVRVQPSAAPSRDERPQCQQSSMINDPGSLNHVTLQMLSGGRGHAKALKTDCIELQNTSVMTNVWSKTTRSESGQHKRQNRETKLDDQTGIKKPVERASDLFIVNMDEKAMAILPPSASKTITLSKSTAEDFLSCDSDDTKVFSRTSFYDTDYDTDFFIPQIDGKEQKSRKNESCCSSQNQNTVQLTRTNDTGCHPINKDLVQRPRKIKRRCSTENKNTQQQPRKSYISLTSQTHIEVLRETEIDFFPQKQDTVQQFRDTDRGCFSQGQDKIQQLRKTDSVVCPRNQETIQQMRETDSGLYPRYLETNQQMRETDSVVSRTASPTEDTRLFSIHVLSIVSSSRAQFINDQDVTCASPRISRDILKSR
ncbi:hypothetical protein ElyMa_004685400 [Elysia marginata]|uniref:G-protein coupled receptors family 1 profile domain-containing protein n=1 Tax=Elysia marginata TaxID=1093978 RepID=A0AAV4IA83_9GAST|nr:hypothetical protein ElyMa_004685400 [Elysia marginata]